MSTASISASLIQPARTSAPPVVVDRVTIGDAKVFVVRDDLLSGGTKERGLGPLVNALVARGVRRVVYASPFCGYAQIALASVARPLGCEVVLFCESDPSGDRLHAYSQQAEARGARVTRCATLAEAEQRASEYAREDAECAKLPLGFACPEFFRAYEDALRIEWRRVEAAVGRTPDRLFLPVGSSTLLRAFVRVVPPSVAIEAIDVNVLDPSDERIRSIAELPRVRLHRAPIAFAKPSPDRPPFPSNPFYDAKLFPFVASFAGTASVWWNVAR